MGEKSLTKDFLRRGKVRALQFFVPQRDSSQACSAQRPALGKLDHFQKF